MVSVRASMARQDDRIPRPKVLEIGAATTATLRERMLDDGVIRLMDFAYGLLATGVVAQKDYRGAARARKGEIRTFHDALMFEYSHFHASIAAGDFQRFCEILGRPRMGAVDLAPKDLAVLVGMGGAPMFGEAGDHFRMTKAELLHAIAFGALLSVWSGARPGDEQEALDAFLEDAPLKIDTYDLTVPSWTETFG